MQPDARSYPAGLSIDMPSEYDRLTVFFRALWVLPVLVLAGLLFGYGSGFEGGEKWRVIVEGGGFVIVPTALMILFRKKYPRWWFDWNVALTAFAYRVLAYLLLLTDEYPSTDEEQSVHVRLVYPNAESELMRGLPLVKWLLAIPHILLLWLCDLALMIAMPLIWLVVLFTGGYPADLFDLVVGLLRWHLRVLAYALLMTTDAYPPFTLRG